MLRSAPPAPLRKTLQIKSFNGRPPPPGRLENSELAANSRKYEYSVSLPLCLAGFWLIKGGVPFWHRSTNPHNSAKPAGTAVSEYSRKATAGEGSLYPLCLMRSAPPAPLTETGTSFLSLPGRPPPPGRLEMSELAANSRKKEYSVSLPLCLAGFWLIKGGVPIWPAAKIAHSCANHARRAVSEDSRTATAGEVSLYPWHILLRSAPPAPLRQTLQIKSFNGRPPPPGRLENSELAANSRKKEYSVSLPLCLAGFWLIKGGVPFWPGAKIAHS
jgi:hypothetical protein